VRQPTVWVKIGPSAIARDTSGELVETVDFLPDGQPDWTSAGICDGHGGGGDEGYRALCVAMKQAEDNAAMCGFDLVFVEDSSPEARIAELEQVLREIKSATHLNVNEHYLRNEIRCLVDREVYP
jgi:hypothetical protein